MASSNQATSSTLAASASSSNLTTVTVITGNVTTASNSTGNSTLTSAFSSAGILHCRQLLSAGALVFMLWFML
ncbi:hypothetical protein MHYP_G00242210 [Metynnis hypsauchen]